MKKGKSVAEKIIEGLHQKYDSKEIKTNGDRTCLTGKERLDIAMEQLRHADNNMSTCDFAWDEAYDKWISAFNVWEIEIQQIEEASKEWRAAREQWGKRSGRNE